MRTSSALIPCFLVAASASLEAQSSRRRPMPPTPPTPPAAQQSAPAPAPAAPPVHGPRLDVKDSSPTRLMFSVFRVQTSIDRLTEIDPAGLQDKAADRERLLKALGEYGTCRLVLDINTEIDLAAGFEFTQGRRVPTVQDVTMSRDGRATPSVTYQQVGAMLELTGRWRDAQAGIGDLAFEFEMSSVGKTNVEVSSGVKLPSFDQVKITQQTVVEAGRPVLVISNDVPQPGDDAGGTVVTILRLVAERLEHEAHATATQPEGQVRAGPPTLIRAEILELTGKRGELRWDRIKEALDADATLEQNVANLKEFGQAEPLSNPSMLANWPQEAEIVVGERVPVVESAFVDGRGDPQPKIRYEDVGVRMSIEGRWLTTDERARAELVIDAERTAMGSSWVTVASGVTLPVFTQRRTKRNLTVEESKPVWLACSEWPTATSEEKESLVLMRIMVSRAG